ncbi:carbon-nitrogen hydrolase [Thozetella sp. PMI_491]|nr:carbon-nitrogen hydrolase [Thozetella sp. PMI_491]
MASSAPSSVRVAVAQFEPVWLDLQGTVDKTCRLLEEAAVGGAQLVAFPECWIPGYPAWIWTRSVDFDLSTAYIQNSLRVDSPEMQRICDAAAKHKISVVLGFSENHRDSLYISQVVIDADGIIQVNRRKLKATHMERTIFGEASGLSLKNVVELEGIGRVGALSCWEHTQPLLKYHTYHQNESIHVAAWPPLFAHGGGPDLWSMSSEGARCLSQTYAIESQSFVLHATAIISKSGIEKLGTGGGLVMNTPGGGSSAIFGPDGRLISEPVPETEEGFIFMDLPMADRLKSRGFLDVCGHYSRSDLLWLGVDDRDKTPLGS